MLELDQALKLLFGLTFMVRSNCNECMDNHESDFLVIKFLKICLGFVNFTFAIKM